MNLRKITLKYMGWCPGVKSAAKFIPDKEINVPLYALILFALAFVVVQLTGAGSIFHVNRLIFIALMGFIVLAGILWKRFKPEGWELPEFEYRPLTIDDLPDIPIDAWITWGSGGFTMGMGRGPGREMAGTEVSGLQMREPDIAYYRGAIERHRIAWERRMQGLPPSDVLLPLEERFKLERPEVDHQFTMKILAITFSVFLGCALLLYLSHPPIPVGPLQVTIGAGPSKQVFYDYEFNESYDYGRLWGRERGYEELVIFRERLNPAEFASGSEAEEESLVFETLDEVCRYVREEVGAPNVIVGLTRFLLNSTFEDIFYSTTVGDVNVMGHPAGIHYDIMRTTNYQTRDENFIGDGLFIMKSMVRGAAAYEWIWSLSIDAEEIYAVEYYHLVFENPRYEVKFIRYPRGHMG